MFEAHFGLRENPFSTSHDPRFVYPSPEHLEAVAHFRYGLQNNEGFVLVTGEVGTGKTTAILDLVSRLPQHAQVALIQNTALSRPELIEEICRRFGVEVGSGLSKPALLARLEQTLRERAGRGQACLLVVDEAQNLTPEMLEEIRLLSNFELGGSSHFLICLVGQPELEERLARSELRQLRQRISVKYHLQPLDRVECGRFLHHRLRVAGGDGDYLFPSATVDLLHGVTNGIPREINIVAGQAMLNAYVEGSPTVQPEHVLQVVEEFAFRSVIGDTAAQSPEPAPAPTPPPAPTTPPAPRPRVAPRPAAAGPPAAPSAHRETTPSPPRAVAERPAVESADTEPPTAPPPTVLSPPASEPERERDVEPTPAGPVEPASPAAERSEAVVGSRRERRGRLPAGLIATVLLVLVVALAFWTGRAQNLWTGIFPAALESSDEEPAAGAPSASSVPSEPESPPPAPATPVPAASSPEPAAQSAAAPASRRGWSVQVASFLTMERARSALRVMEQRTGSSGYVVSGVGEDGRWHAVRLGSYASRAEAQSAAEDWTEREWIPIDRFVTAP